MENLYDDYYDYIMSMADVDIMLTKLREQAQEDWEKEQD